MQLGTRAKTRRQRRDVQRRVALVADLDVADLGAVTDDEIECGVDLIVDAVRPFVVFDQRHLRARLDSDPRAGEGRRRLVAMGEDKLDRVSDRRILRNVDDSAVGHKGCVERQCDVVLGAGGRLHEVGVSPSRQRTPRAM